MNYTENYQLPQWVETDRIMMEDFNEAMAKTEDAVNSVKTSSSCISGTYEGNGSTVTVNTGFRPSFLQILVPNRGTNQVYDVIAAIGGNGCMLRVTRNASCGITNSCQFTETGFTITDSSDTALNTTGVVYHYLAFY